MTTRHARYRPLGRDEGFRGGFFALTGLLLLGGCGGTKQPDVLSGELDGGAGLRDGGEGGFVPSDARLSTDAGNLSVNPVFLDFGQTKCGTTASPRTLTFTNTGIASLTWTASLVKEPNSPFELDVTSGSLENSESKIIKVTPKAIPTPASVDTNGYGDTVIIKTNRIGDVPRSVVLTQTASGAILAFNPAILDFQSVPVGAQSTKNVNIINHGNVTADYSLTTGTTTFAIDPTSQTNVAAGGNAQATILFVPSTPSAATGGLSILLPTTTPLCAPLPTPVVLNGVGTQGKLIVSPNEIYFGSGGDGFVDCGDTAPAKTLSLQNNGTAKFDWKAELSAGSTYYTITPSSGTIPAGGQVTATLTTKQIPQNSPIIRDFYSGTLTIQTSQGANDAVVIPLHMTARGVILSSTLGSSYSFGGSYVGQEANTQLSITNSGNISSTVTLAVGNSPTFGVSPLVPTTIGAGLSTSFSLKFLPLGTDIYNDTLTMAVAPGAVLCSPIPPPTTLSGQGSNSVQVTPTSLDFGIVNCGTSVAPQDITIENRGTALTFVTSLAKGSNSPYDVNLVSNGIIGASTKSDTQLPNGITTIRITPKVSFNVATTETNGQGDVLTVTYKGQGATAPSNIQLNQTARGTIFAVSPLSVGVEFTASSTGPKFPVVRVENKGNYPGVFQLSNAPAIVPPAVCDPAELFCIVGQPTGNLAPATGQDVVLWINKMTDIKLLGFAALTTTSTPLLLCADIPRPIPVAASVLPP